MKKEEQINFQIGDARISLAFNHISRKYERNTKREHPDSEEADQVTLAARHHTKMPHDNIETFKHNIRILLTKLKSHC